MCSSTPSVPRNTSMSICASGQRAFSERTSGVVSSTSPIRRGAATRMVRGGRAEENRATAMDPASWLNKARNVQDFAAAGVAYRPWMAIASGHGAGGTRARGSGLGARGSGLGAWGLGLGARARGSALATRRIHVDASRAA
ncbi:hypothetical protein BVI434_520012 [Burkholderia vietnamiensis]|nr:hypothetical protein BVI434_520012 [Burkholderia vietnamiensis]